jgi:hypothetical protein
MWTIQMHDHSTPHNARVWKVAGFVWLLKHVNWSVMQEIRGWCLRFLTGCSVFADAEEERPTSAGEKAASGEEATIETGAGKEGADCEEKKEGAPGDKGKERVAEVGGNETIEKEADAAMKDITVEETATADVYSRITASTRASAPDTSAPHTATGVPPAPKSAPQAPNPLPRPTNGMKEKKMKLNAFHFSYAA